MSAYDLLKKDFENLVQSQNLSPNDALHQLMQQHSENAQQANVLLRLKQEIERGQYR